MDKWVVAWINFFDNEMHMLQINASGEKDALLYALERLLNVDDDDTEDFMSSINKDTINSIKQEAFNLDGMIGAYKL